TGDPLRLIADESLGKLAPADSASDCQLHVAVANLSSALPGDAGCDYPGLRPPRRRRPRGTDRPGWHARGDSTRALGRDGGICKVKTSPESRIGRPDSMNRLARVLIVLGVIPGLVLCLLVTLRLCGLIRPFSVPTAGMAPAVAPGDHVLMEGLTFWR